jgi:hypothetical protein
MTTKSTFPISNFSFSGGSIGYVCAQRFLSIYGKQIKGLKLKESLLIVEDRFGDLLAVRAPNIQILSIEFPRLWEKSTAQLFSKATITKLGLQNGQQLTLPHLRRLEIRRLKENFYAGWAQALSQILSCAVNLQEIKADFNILYAPILISTNKLHLATSFSFAPSNNNLQAFEQLVNAEPTQLKNLELEIRTSEFNVRSNETWTRSAELINKLLELPSVQLTLNTLCINGSLGFLYNYGLELPKLENVNKLEFNIEPRDIQAVNGPRPIFPTSFNFSEIFPNLHTISLYLTHCNMRGNVSFKELFGFGQETLPSVTTLILTYNSYINTYVELSHNLQFNRLFPNITHLEYNDLARFRPHKPQIWQVFRLIKSLKLRIGLNDWPQYSMDSIFTGLIKEICDELRSTPQIVTRSHVRRRRQIQHLAREPSILDLNILKCLQVHFQTRKQYQQQMSNVSHKFVFNLMEDRQGLQTKITFEEN